MSPSERPSPIFPRLSGGAAAPSPERAAAHRRGRLKGAMVAAVARHGYPAVTIDELVALAGISKRDFYESFASKEECFLATFEEVVDLGTEAVRSAFREASEPRESLLAGIGAFGAALVERNDAMSLAIVDSLSLGTAALGPRERAETRFAELMGQSLGLAAGQEREVSELVIRGLVGGMRRVAYKCLRDDQPQRFCEHLAELLDWSMGYGRRTGGSSTPLPLPSGVTVQAGAAEGNGTPALGWGEPPGSERSRAALEQRERIIRAVARLAAAGGYASLSMPAIASAAAVSNRTFYREFSNKQEAFVAAFDALAKRAFLHAVGAVAEGQDWPQSVAAALQATLEFVAADPLFARLAFFELAAAGPIGLDHAERSTERFMILLSPAALPEAVQPLPEVIVEAIGGGIWTVIQVEINSGRSESLPELGPELTHFALAPFGVAAPALSR